MSPGCSTRATELNTLLSCGGICVCLFEGGGRGNPGIFFPNTPPLGGHFDDLIVIRIDVLL